MSTSLEMKSGTYGIFMSNVFKLFICHGFLLCKPPHENTLTITVEVKIILHIHLPPRYPKWSLLASQHCLACGLSAIVFLCECVQCSGTCLNYGGGKLYGRQVAAIRLYTLIPLLFSVCVRVCMSLDNVVTGYSWQGREQQSFKVVCVYAVACVYVRNQRQ